jgi:hypothetical protein
MSSEVVRCQSVSAFGTPWVLLTKQLSCEVLRVTDVLLSAFKMNIETYLLKA